MKKLKELAEYKHTPLRKHDSNQACHHDKTQFSAQMGMLELLPQRIQILKPGKDPCELKARPFGRENIPWENATALRLAIASDDVRRLALSDWAAGLNGNVVVPAIPSHFLQTPAFGFNAHSATFVPMASPSRSPPEHLMPIRQRSFQVEETEGCDDGWILNLV